MTTLRERQLGDLQNDPFDVIVVGAGINGAVSAAALAARGARVALLDERDFAGFTSQESSNLAWGGIKYLEGWELGLVRDLCRGRNELVRAYPGMVREIRFLAMIERGFRYRPWVMQLGAWAYWLLGSGATRTPRRRTRRAVERHFPGVATERFAGCIEYSDAFLYDNDARFVFDFVRRALDSGASAVNYVAAAGARRVDGAWVVDAEDRRSGRTFAVRARAMVNAAGAFADDLNQRSGVATRYRHLFSKGVHLIVDRICDPDHVLAFFADDGRLFFAIPMGARTCLGTTDTRVSEPTTRVSDADRSYVLDNINRRLRLAEPLTTADVIAERCGVRPLAVEGQADGGGEDADFLQLSRRHVVESNVDLRHLTIFGGKLTDCVNVGEEICEHVAGFGIRLGRASGRWYGEPDAAARSRFFERARAIAVLRPEHDPDRGTSEGDSEAVAERLWRRYGEAAHGLLDRIEASPDQALPLVLGASYRRCELYHAAEREMVVDLDDLLRRRSRIAMVLPREVLRQAPGVREACEVLFPGAAAERFDEYFEGSPRRAGAGRRGVLIHPTGRLPAQREREEWK